MRNTSQDIYGTDRKKPEGEPGDDVDPAGLLSKPWFDAVRRERRSTVVLVSVALIMTLLVAAVVVQQYLLLARRPSDRDAVWTRVSKLPPSSVLDLNAESEAQTIVDELTEAKVLKVPDSGNMPFNAQWVKQAAYHVVQAEKASREERLDDALDEYAKAHLIFPQLGGVERQIGLIHLRQKDYTAAAAMFEKCAAEEEMTFGLANNLGVAYLAIENHKKAEQMFLEAVRLNPKYPLAYFNLATLYIRTGDLVKAGEYFDRYLGIRPDDLTAAQTYAKVLIDLKQWDKAATLLGQISRLVPDVAPVQFRLAEALSHTSDRAASIKALRHATGLVDPRKALGWMSRPEFNLLRNDPDFQQLLDQLGAAE